MSTKQMEEFLAFALELAEQGRAVLSAAYRSNFSVRQKADSSAVTDIDEQVEVLLSESIKQRYPNHDIQGEEFGLTSCNSDYKWFIDPIDGTVSFLVGRPLFCQLIALQSTQAWVLGVVDQAITQERWWGVRGQGAFYNGQAIHTRDCTQLADAVIATTSEEYFSESELKQYQAVAAKAQHRIMGGDAYNYALLAQGQLDVVMEAGLKPHDYAALVPLIEEAGGVITDWQGRALEGTSPSTVLACGDSALHAQLISDLAG